MTELAALRLVIEQYKKIDKRQHQDYIPPLIDALERVERTVRKHQALVDTLMKYI